jgi:hypothetical protein
MPCDDAEAAWEPVGWLAHHFRLNPATDLYQCGHCGQHAWRFERAKDLDARLTPCPANPYNPVRAAVLQRAR